MPVCHTHQRAGVETQEQEALMLELEAFAAEYLSESGTAGIAPFGFVVAQYHIIFRFQQVEARFHFLHGCAVALLGKVARHQYEVDAVRCIDLRDRAQQVFGRGGIARVQMDVRQLCETERPLLCLCHEGQQANKQDTDK